MECAVTYIDKYENDCLVIGLSDGTTRDFYELNEFLQAEIVDYINRANPVQ